VKRKDYTLILEMPDGSFEWNAGMGWMPCLKNQTDFILVSERIQPKFVDRLDRPCRSNEAPIGLQAFGKPFFVPCHRAAESAS
jgi:hypothetical protein